ncbi:MAG TPA: hypothetical protein VF902_04290, partial [Coriobacteriia bacterium]
MAGLVFNLTLVTGSVLPSIAAASTNRLISASGTTTIRATPPGSAAVQFPEIRGEPEADQSDTKAKPGLVNRSHSPKHAPTAADIPAAPADAAAIAGAPGVDSTFAGLNHFDQRTANGGNQFSLEPPDQGLCAANGFILETVNDVMKVYNTAGGTVVGTTDQNTFYGYQPAITRPAGPFGEFVTDPSCYYDVDTNTWFHVVLTLDIVPATGDFTG